MLYMLHERDGLLESHRSVVLWLLQVKLQRSATMGSLDPGDNVKELIERSRQSLDIAVTSDLNGDYDLAVQKYTEGIRTLTDGLKGLVLKKHISVIGNKFQWFVLKNI